MLNGWDKAYIKLLTSLVKVKNTHMISSQQKLFVIR